METMRTEGYYRAFVPSVDEALPCTALLVAQRHHRVFGNAAERAALVIAEAVDHGIIGIAHGRSTPDVSVFIFELDVIAVTIAEHARLGLFFFQVKKTAGQVEVLALLAINHRYYFYYSTKW